jgi:transposase-like protein
MISFKGTHFPKDVILYTVFFYVRYGVSYRDLEEIMEERGVNVDHLKIFTSLKLRFQDFQRLIYVSSMRQDLFVFRQVWRFVSRP